MFKVFFSAFFLKNNNLQLLKRIPKYSPSDNDTNGFSNIFKSIFFIISPICYLHYLLNLEKTEESSKFKDIYSLNIKLPQTANNEDKNLHNKYKIFAILNLIPIPLFALDK